jgi:putative endonuclease
MFQPKNGYVYFMMNKTRTVIYVGVTSDLKRRVYEHKTQRVEGFTKKYKVHDLVYYEIFDRIEDGIIREKQIKAGSRKKKMDLILLMNRSVKDLYEEI